MKPVHIHQIYYDDASRALVDPAFIPLDNHDNARPDWREYWPMRNFLKSTVLDENAYYGFFSPKFQLKTGLTGAAVLEFIEANDADVYVFSPYVEQASFFLNVFEHGEANHPGMLAAMQQFVDQIGLPVDLRTFVCGYANSVFSNYFVAKAAFWREWLEMGEKLFALAESDQGPLAQLLNSQAKYHAQAGAVGLKVFIMERLVTLILMFQRYSSKAYDPFALTRTPIPAAKLDHEMRIANALKVAFLDTRDFRYIQSYVQFRDSVIAVLGAGATVKKQNEESHLDDRFVEHKKPVLPDELKIAFIGNSITLHGPKPELGWPHENGMAASGKELDYAHVLLKHLAISEHNAYVRNFYPFETDLAVADSHIDSLREVFDKKPPIIVIQLGDNVANQEQLNNFGFNLKRLVEMAVNHSENVFVISTWWQSQAKDDTIRHVCEMCGASYVFIGDLFDHHENADRLKRDYVSDGVDTHPKDWGMAQIGFRILQSIVGTVHN